ncbi:hypothetical protein [Streptomyces sp. NPDC053560]|uniref:hypothetical protein n=1 Tax=Streptomyces sp. NPDC053560 TaxID=3365711 RepID=UPI0037D3BD13
MRPYAEGCRRGGDRTGPFLAPRTATGLRLRNALLSRRFLRDRMLKERQKVSSTVALPDHGADHGAGPVADPGQRRDSGIASPHGASLRP